MPVDIAVSIDDAKEYHAKPAEEVVNQDAGEQPNHLRYPFVFSPDIYAEMGPRAAAYPRVPPAI